MKINIAKIIGSGYKTFWFSKKRYVCVKGSRGSKKSKTAALWIIYNMMKYSNANTLVIRRTFNTLKDSVWTDLQWACNKLCVSHLWKFSKSPLEAEYIPTRQKILFRGLDNPLSITSITVSKGILCWCLFEEAFQIENEDDFNKIDMSIRGILPEGLFFRIMLIFNPWSENHWLKKRFFDNPDENTLALTTTYKNNEWIGKETIELFEQMKKNNPRRYRIEGLGEWGIAEGLIFDNWEVKDFNVKDIKGVNIYGCDFGFNDPTTIISSILDEENKIIYVYDEYYKSFMTADDIAEVVKKKNINRSLIIADCSRPEIIADLNRKGCKFKGCTKGKDSIITGINKLQEYKIIVNPSCQHLIVEFNNYCWDKDKFGNNLDKPIDNYNHCIDALRYSLQSKKNKISNNLSKYKLGIY